MKTKIIMLTVLALAMTPLYAKKSIAVLPFTAKQGVNQNAADLAADAFRVALFDRDAYTVLDRANMEDTLAEQGRSLSETCDNTQCAIELGQVLKMQYMVTGTLSKVGERYYLSISVVNVTTSEVDKSSQEEFPRLDDANIGVHNILVEFFGGVRQPYGGEQSEGELDRFKRTFNTATTYLSTGAFDKAIATCEALIREIDKSTSRNDAAFTSLRKDVVATLDRAKAGEKTGTLEEAEKRAKQGYSLFDAGNREPARVEYLAAVKLLRDSDFTEDSDVAALIKDYEASVVAIDTALVDEIAEAVVRVVEEDGDPALLDERFDDARAHYRRAVALVEDSRFKGDSALQALVRDVCARIEKADSAEYDAFIAVFNGIYFRWKAASDRNAAALVNKYKGKMTSFMRTHAKYENARDVKARYAEVTR